MSDDGKERISLEGYSVTDDERLYLQALCDGSKRPTNIANKLAKDLATGPGKIATELTPEPSKGPHRTATVADRLAYLADYEGTEHLVERDGDRFALTEPGRAIFC